DNPTVARPLSACADGLTAAGLAVDLERWNVADGKGLDDLLANGKQPELLTGDTAWSAIRDIFAAATADEEPGPPDDLDRLQGVLDSGGAEALFRDRKLLQALAKLRAADPAEFAAVRAQIGKRVKLRDLENALRPFRPELVSSDGPTTPPYFEDHGC